jgi:DNA-binding transcriptional regulator YhcF (GntR family)
MMNEDARHGAMNGEQVERHLRYQIVGLLHVGRLKRGVPLPSIRGVARSLGVDHRLVAGAYRALEAEGWWRSVRAPACSWPAT